MLTTTLKEIKAAGPCESRYKLAAQLCRNAKRKTTDPIAYTEILEHMGLGDCLWAICRTLPDPHRERILRMSAITSACDVYRLMLDPRSHDALRVAHLYLHGEATDKDLDAARDAAWTARDAAGAAARAAAWTARDAAWDAARAAWDAAWTARDAAWDAARAAWDAARDAEDAAGARQRDHLRAILENYEAAWMED